MIISKTPLRISFLGGGTDLSSFYSSNNYGSVISSCIDSFLYVTIKKQNEIFEEKYRLNYSETELVSNLENIKHPIIRESIKFLEIKEPLYISTIADVPSHTGLGSSSSFTVGLLNALYSFNNHKISSHQLAEIASDIEINKLNQTLGKQDHYAAAFGGLNLFNFNSDESVTVNKLNISKNNSKILSSSLLLFWTDMSRSSQTILSDQDKKNIQNSKILLNMRDQVKIFRTLVESKTIDLKSIGQLIGDGWEYKKKLSSLITNELIDDVYQNALKQGAYGGKVLGAGGGGFLMLVVNPELKSMIIKNVESMGFKYYNFNFESKGTEVTNIY